ncbi:hypothetical protein IAT40_006254 [Kwoniella sp. CBS 6097]
MPSRRTREAKAARGGRQSRQVLEPLQLEVRIEEPTATEAVQNPPPSGASSSAVKWEEMKTPQETSMSLDTDQLEWIHLSIDDLATPAILEATPKLETPDNRQRSSVSGHDTNTGLGLSAPTMLGLGIHLPAEPTNVELANTYLNTNALLNNASSSLIVCADPPMSMEGIAPVPLLLSPDSEPNDSSVPTYLSVHRSRSTTVKRRRYSSTRAKSLDQTLGQAVKEGLEGEQLLIKGDPLRFQYEMDKLRGFDRLKKEDTYILEAYGKPEEEPSVESGEIKEEGGKDESSDILEPAEDMEMFVQENHEGEAEQPMLPQFGLAPPINTEDAQFHEGQNQFATRRHNLGDQAFRGLFVPPTRHHANQPSSQDRFHSLTQPSSSNLDQILTLPALLASVLPSNQPVPSASGNSNMLHPLPALVPIPCNVPEPSANDPSPEHQTPGIKAKRGRRKSQQADQVAQNDNADQPHHATTNGSKAITIVRTLVQAKEAIETLQEEKRKLERERDWTWQVLVWTNKVADALVHPSDYGNTTVLTGRLCSKFLSDPPLHPPPEYPALFGVRPVSELYAIVVALANAVGCKAPAFENIGRDPLTEQMFHRVVQTLLAGFDATIPIRDHTYTPDQFPSYTPPDVLWILVHLGDPVFVEPLTSAIRTALWACSDTRRGMVLLLLFGRIAGGKMSLGANNPVWAKQQVQRWEENGYRLLSLDDGLNRVTEEDVKSALGHLMEKRRLEEERQLNNGHEYVMAERKPAGGKGKNRAGTETTNTAEVGTATGIEAEIGNGLGYGDEKGDGNPGGEDSVATRVGARGRKRVKNTE